MRFRFLLLVSTLFAALPGRAGIVSSYEMAHELCADGGLYAIRKFEESGTEKFLVVDTETLKSKVVEASDLHGCISIPIGARGAPRHGGESAYFKAVMAYSPVAAHPENVSACHGFKEFPAGCAQGAPMVLTGDLCPSSKSQARWERDVKPFLITLAGLKGRRTGRPTPIVLAATGHWLRHHQRELREIKALDLDITWANHSDTHGVNPGPGISDEKAFLTQKSAHEFEREVFGAEIAMLENGLVPAPFFRFPGLFSTDAQIEMMRAFGLIPLNTTAWLALDRSLPRSFRRCGMSSDQAAAAGRIILTHANANEPLGIARASRLLERQNDNDDLLSIQSALKCEVDSSL